MIQLAIHEAINGRDLDYAIARATMEEMMDGTATDIEMATLLTALRMKGETITEITACAEVMREKGAHIEPKGAVMDIVGTGGDEVGSFNISTTAAFVAAAGGVPVAKHGNRSVSSKSGAADVLEELDVVLSLLPEQNEKVLADTGICFLFAQGYHKSMKNVAPVRKGMGERTIFNVLGPLSNPARATMQLLGVYDESLVMPMAQVLSNLGVTRGMVVITGGPGTGKTTIIKCILSLLPGDDALWTAPNLLLTPHVSGFYHLPVTLDNIVSIAAGNIRALLSGDELRNRVP